MKPVGAALAQEYGHTLLNYPEERWLPLVRDVAIAAMLVQIKEDLAALDMKHDVFFSERSLTAGADEIKATIEELRGKGLVYEGRLEKPKGHDDDEWEDREQTLFKSTDVRRRRRPRADEVGRQLHLFRRRHGLSPQQARRGASCISSTCSAPTTPATSPA